MLAPHPSTHGVPCPPPEGAGNARSGRATVAEPAHPHAAAHAQAHVGEHVELVDLVDFKWLMAAEGRRVHLERLQADRVYATGCFAAALASGSATLRQRARQLQACLS